MSNTPLEDLIKHELFAKQVLNEKEISSYEYYLQTTANQDVSAQTNYVIQNLNAGGDTITDLSNAFLMVNWYLVTAGGALPNAGAVNGLTRSAWSLFKNARLEISGEIVDSCLDPGHVHNILIKASKDRETIRSMAADEFYYPAGLPFDAANNTGATDTNFAKGAARLIAASQSTSGLWSKLYLRDVFGFCNQRKVFPNMSWILRMDKETTYENILMRTNAGADVDLATKIAQIQLYVPALKAKDPLATKYFSLNALRSEPMPLDWMKIGYQRLSITNSTTLQNVTIFSGVRSPRYVFVAPQLVSGSAAQSTGAGAVNSGAYVSNATSQCYIMVNGKQYPFMRYQGSAYGYVREVEMLRTAFNKHLDHGAPIFDMVNFPTHHSIYYFDISHVDNLYEENSADATIQVYYQSAEANPIYLHCVFLAEMHQKLELVGSTLHVASAN